MSAGDRIRRTVKTNEPTEAVPFRRPNGRASYPRRVTLDLDDARYDFLRGVAWDKRTSIAELLRAAVDVLMSEVATLDRIADAAGADIRPHPRSLSNGMGGAKHG